jgi:hypothetical protein
MTGKPANESPTAPQSGKIKTPVSHGKRDHTSGMDTVEERQGSRNANIETPQQKYRKKRSPAEKS